MNGCGYRIWLSLIEKFSVPTMNLQKYISPAFGINMAPTGVAPYLERSKDIIQVGVKGQVV